MKVGTKRLAANEQGDGVEVQKRPRTASTHTRKYNPNWQKEFSWLKFDAEQNKMYCSFCKEAGTEIAGQTDFVTGCTSFKKETLSIHGTSNRHRRARDHVIGKQKPAFEGPLSKVFQKIHSQNDKDARAEMAIKMNTAYFIAKEELPFTKYAGLIQLQKKNDLDVGVTYANDMKCAEMTEIIGKLLADDLSIKLNKAHFISVLIDGTSDVSGTENETMHCKMVETAEQSFDWLGTKLLKMQMLQVKITMRLFTFFSKILFSIITMKQQPKRHPFFKSESILLLSTALKIGCLENNAKLH